MARLEFQVWLCPSKKTQVVDDLENGCRLLHLDVETIYTNKIDNMIRTFKVVGDSNNISVLLHYLHLCEIGSESFEESYKTYGLTCVWFREYEV